VRKAELEKIKGLIQAAIVHQQSFVDCFKDGITENAQRLHIECKAEVAAYENVLLALNGTVNPLIIAGGVIPTK
jgi:hypothetical protein